MIVRRFKGEVVEETAGWLVVEFEGFARGRARQAACIRWTPSSGDGQARDATIAKNATRPFRN
jgi:hypothetical protein